MAGKEEIIEKIRKGEVIVYEPGKGIPFLRKWQYLKVLERIQPATIDEIVKELGKSKKQGVKAFLTKLIKKGEVQAVVYKGEIYYLAKEKYEELTKGGSS